MGRTNANKKTIYTHEGAIARHINPELQLRRSVMTCLLWEDNFYEDGESIATRISELIKQVSPEKVAAIAIEAREEMKLRHVPLLIVREMCRYPEHKKLVAKTLDRVIQRPDELSEFLALYWKDKKVPLASQVKKGLAKAFTKFSAYSLAKYNQAREIKLRDTLFLCHAKPKDEEQAKVFTQLVEGNLPVPDIWETALGKENKKETWERLIQENKLGALAFIRNLRNMHAEKVDEKLLLKGLENLKIDRVLPFRFIAAARHAPQWEPQLEQLMFKSLESHEKLKGKTVIVIDNSGSMHGTSISAKSEIDRADAACALAILLREICELGTIISFASQPQLIPPRRGFALADAIKRSPSGGTNTDYALAMAEQIDYDRIIVITDEQSHQSIRKPKAKGYFINVSNNQNGIGYGDWVHIDGWSEAIVNFIQNYENLPS